ncbi:MAG TPA: LacI family DNA-binding transcriptional regulator [Planctomycetota bacterium]|nr:LacI family DNA-binding transcriptional regulator [Planctomycetota bacterium]
MESTRKRFRPDRAGVIDVARLAGVSTATVSRVLNHSRLVRPEVCERVWASAKQLNYQLNSAARDLARSRSSMVLLEVSDPAHMTFSHAALLRTLASRILARGEFPTIISPDLLASNENAATLGMVATAAGAVSIETTSIPGRLQSNALPHVVVDAAEEESVSAVVLDRRRAYARVAEHLLRNNHRRIGYIGSESDVKYLGLSETAKAGGARCTVVPERNLAPFLHSERKASRVTAWVLPGELIVVPTVMQLLAAGRRIGIDTAVVCQGDSQLARCAVPPLTALRHPNDLIANIALDLLSAQQADRRKRQRVTVDLELVVRASSDFQVRN